ncbi:hypothetical protein JTB14_015606 [Gonioctena quinquepunctata]|nr:hypothetical protein JTB14_015606 [Gonioctena quinquepunctata]
MKQLQTQEKHFNGATLEEIEKFMIEYYCITGYIHSELENSLSKAIQSRFLVKNETYYTLVPPYAILFVIPEVCSEAKLKDIQESSRYFLRGDLDGKVTVKSERIEFLQKVSSNCNLEKRVCECNFREKKSSKNKSNRKRCSYYRSRS